MKDLRNKDRRTSFKAYENMPIYLRLAFAFGVFL